MSPPTQQGEPSNPQPWKGKVIAHTHWTTKLQQPCLVKYQNLKFYYGQLYSMFSAARDSGIEASSVPRHRGPAVGSLRSQDESPCIPNVNETGTMQLINMHPHPPIGADRPPSARGDRPGSGLRGGPFCYSWCSLGSWFIFTLSTWLWLRKFPVTRGHQITLVHPDFSRAPLSTTAPCQESLFCVWLLIMSLAWAFYRDGERQHSFFLLRVFCY